ncbi:MAG TPA: hypothetical protein VHC72_15515 [Bryobacteraceae bacterium]|nr:hypothetical protein [Bryobacteraceae bacterium]
MPKTPKDSALKTAAVAIGEIAGKAVAAAESVLPHRHAAASPAPKAAKASGKLPPKHKSRLPRRQKKALARAQNKA